jgi:DNA repair exonuclease SbcCD ATPase subunit
MRIAHIADVHIRSLSRHDEYKEVFQSFIEDCRKNSVDHIFIGGDIYHTKTSGISPEYIDFLKWWLDALSSVAEVHLILGNHDGNLVNLSRQDAISPIVSALNNPRINLYKKSGVYEFFPGFTWCVFSLFDEEGWKDVKPIKGKFNIACYHGSVRGSVTETGWDITEGITTDFFKDFDLCLLGDIHKQQFLGYRNNKPWIGYPGTVIQQGYAEDLIHGYLLWEIESSDWNVKFNTLPNPKPYVTLEWNGSQDELVKLAQPYPKQTRFRIKSSISIPQSDIKVITDVLKSTHTASEITFKSDVKVEPDATKTQNITEKLNLRSQDTVIELLQKFCKEKKFVNVDWKSTEAEVKKYLTAALNGEEITRGSSWSLKHLKWDNLFAYGADNEIDFSNLSGIVGIFGSNRIGKSSIVGTIMYSLFNTTDRGAMKNLQICNVRKQYCSARAIFEHDGKTYVTERQTSKFYNKKGAQNATTALNLFRMNNEEAEDLCGEQRADTEKTIKSLIGTSDDFLLTSLSAQGETGAFMLLSSAKRRALLSRFLDLDVFDRMYEVANKDLLVYKSRLKSMPEKDWISLHSEHETLCSNLMLKIQQNTQTINQLQHKLSELRSELSSHKNFKPVTIIEVEEQEKIVNELKHQAENCNNKIHDLQNEIADLSAKLDTISPLLDSEDIQVFKDTLASINSLEKTVETLRHIYEKEASKTKQHQKSLNLLKEVPCGDEYPTCKFIKDAHEDRANFLQQQEAEAKAKKDLENAIASLRKLDKDAILAKITKREKAKDLANTISLQISRKETEIEKIRSSCEACTQTLATAIDKLGNLKEALKNEENYEVVNLRTKIEELSRTIKRLDSEKLEAATQHGKALSDLEKSKNEKEQRHALLVEMKTLEMICEAFSKKGLPLIITKTQLPIINAEIAKILNGIVDFTVELENDDETDSTEIYINYGDSRRVIELCSGMEKTIGAIAIRVALINVSTLPKSDMFIIDEGFGTLDESGVEACNRMLASLKKYFRIVLVITHVDGIKDMADHIIEITKKEKDSSVVFA